MDADERYSNPLLLVAFRSGVCSSSFIVPCLSLGAGGGRLRLDVLFFRRDDRGGDCGGRDTGCSGGVCVRCVF